MSYLSKHGYVLKKCNFSNDELIKLKHELRGRPLQDSKYAQFNKDTTFPLYIETKNKLYIPKVYGIKKYGSTKELENYSGERWSSEGSFCGTLFDYQEEPCNILYDELVNGSGGGILSLGTGYGKTFCALYVLSKLKYKTIVIVNKISLLKQWEMEAKLYLPGVSIGFIQGQNNVDIVGKDIVIAMLQSLSRIDYPDELFTSFGVTIVDECHNISSPIFSKVLMKVCAKYTIGLSATPTRSDGCEYVFQWFLGDVVYKSKSDRKGLPPIVHTIKMTSKDYKEISNVNKLTGQKQIMFTSMLSDLVTMERRNRLIIELIQQKVQDENRKILVLSDRREHIKTLYKQLEREKSSFTFGMFLGQMKVEALERSKKCQVILATYQAFGEGVSEKTLDTLFLITPKKFIGHLKNTTKNESGKLEQIVGRIFRKEHTQRAPLIVDFQDDFSIYKSQSIQRTTFYKEHFPQLVLEEFKIDLDNLDNNKLINGLVQKKKSQKIIPKESEQISSIYTTCLLED